MDEEKENEIKVTKYQNVPLPDEDYKLLEELCAFYGLGRRGKGAFVARLLREEKRKMESVKEQAVQ